MDRREFVRYLMIGAAVLALPKVVEADPFVKMGFVDKDELTPYPRLYEKRTNYFRKDVRDGWLTVIKHKPGKGPHFNHMPETPWVAHWTPRSHGYVTEWSSYAVDESALMQALERKFT